jgi:hypothetical protein
MSFIAPKWDASQGHYVIEVQYSFNKDTRLTLGRDSRGTYEFVDVDNLHNITDRTIHQLINDGDKNKWFAKLPSHEQLMKRVRHSFNNEPKDTNNAAILTTLLLTPKQITFLWSPLTHTDEAPAMYIDDSEEEDSESDTGTEPEIMESNLPPVALTDDTQQTREEYLLTRLRAARARVEAEQLRMQYFEATGRMPPDSESEDD